MKHDDERVALQAVEFWSTVCDEEIELTNEAIEVFDHNHNNVIYYTLLLITSIN